MAVGDAIAIEFRARNYTSESNAHLLPRFSVHLHPLSSSQVDVIDEEKDNTLDPLTAAHGNIYVAFDDSEVSQNVSKSGISCSNSTELLVKEWTTFKRFLVQRFPASTTAFVSSVADLQIKKLKASDKTSNVHPDELDDPQGSADEDAKFISQQDYIARLMDMKGEIASAWHADDYVRSLKLSVKVARILMDTASPQFYPTLFSIVTDILDMLGDMVWERIKRKAEFSEDGVQICSLPENFQASDVCSDAKETCHNWFCKIGSIHELLPRIYLELAILPCWRFLHDGSADVLQRLVKMMRGLGDPLASAYCHLYLAYSAQKMAPCDKEYLITCITDISLLMVPIVAPKEAYTTATPTDPVSSTEVGSGAPKETTYANSCKRKQVLVRLFEPPVEYIMKCIFKDPPQQASKILVELGLGRNQSQLSGKPSGLSVILHHLLKELPSDVVSSNAVDLLDLIEGSCDSSFDQCMNFRLLGFRLYEKDVPRDLVNTVLNTVIQVVLQYQNLDAYLKVVDGYVDILLQNEMTSHLELLLKGIADRTSNKWISDGELESLQSIFVKILSHMKCLEDILKLNHFVEIVDAMRGNSRNVINVRILDIATRNNYIDCSATIQFLFEVCRDLHDGIDSMNMMDSDNQPLHHLLSRFVQMVDFGTEHERHLSFLIGCREAFSSSDELKETLVHRGNCLSIKVHRDAKRQISFVRSCLAFCEATIPSISDLVKQLILYLETAEVALTSGLVCHSDGLIDSATSCFESLVGTNDAHVPLDVDRIASIVQKLCSLLVMVPGNPRCGVIYIPKSLLSLVNCQSRWITTKLKVKTMCAIISLLATLAQNKLPYHACGLEILGNDDLFFDDPSYHGELASLCDCILQNVVHVLKQEASLIVRGSLALEVCNCIALNFRMNNGALHICNELMDMAKLSANSQHNYVLSTSNFLAKKQQIDQCRVLPVANELQL